jgi:hypothetical protein
MVQAKNPFFFPVFPRAYHTLVSYLAAHRYTVKYTSCHLIIYYTGNFRWPSITC